jgi:hypothetical protein
MPIPGLRWVVKHWRVSAAVFVMLVLVILIGRTEWLSAHKKVVSSVTFLPRNYTIPPQKVPLPDRWIPQKWGWLWRVKEAVLGKAKVVNLSLATYELDAVVLGMQANAEPELGRLLTHPEFVGTNGQRVWLLPNSKILELRKRFGGSAGSRSSFIAGITTADRCQAMLMTTSDLPNGGSRLGKADTLPLVRTGATELTFILQSIMAAPAPLSPADQALGKTSRVLVWPSETNTIAALKLQLTPGIGFFVLDSQRKSSEAIETAVLVTVDTFTNNPAGTRQAAVIKRGK